MCSIYLLVINTIIDVIIKTDISARIEPKGGENIAHSLRLDKVMPIAELGIDVEQQLIGVHHTWFVIAIVPNARANLAKHAIFGKAKPK